MKILLFGKNGQVGWELNRSLQPLGKVIAIGREEADFSNPESLRNILRDMQPDIVVNAAAYTAVDKAEDEKDLALVINGESPGILAEESFKINALLVHYSTDYIFDGIKNNPYVEDDEPKPVNSYGQSKLAGEKAIKSSGCDYLILRTSWVYASRGHNFLLTMLKLAREREELSVVADQIGSPTSARLIADTTAHCIKQSVKERFVGVFSSDLYHLTSSGSTSWHGFAEEVINTVKKKPASKLMIKQLKAIPTVDYPTPATRPMNSQLALKKLESIFSLTMPYWRNELELCIEEINCN